MPHSPVVALADFPLENLALGLLMAQPKHGYQLYQEYEAHFLPIWKAGRSKFYAVLAALHEAGSLDAQTEPQDDHPPRKVYHITPAGRARFEEWLYRPVAPMRAVRVEFLAKLRFMTLLRVDDPGRIFDGQIELCRIALAELDAQQGGDPEADVILELVRDFRRRQVRFIVEWLAACRARICPGASA